MSLNPKMWTLSTDVMYIYSKNAQKKPQQNEKYSILFVEIAQKYEQNLVLIFSV